MKTSLSDFHSLRCKTAAFCYVVLIINTIYQVTSNITCNFKNILCQSQTDSKLLTFDCIVRNYFA